MLFSGFQSSLPPGQDRRGARGDGFIFQTCRRQLPRRFAPAPGRHGLRYPAHEPFCQKTQPVSSIKALQSSWFVFLRSLSCGGQGEPGVQPRPQPPAAGMRQRTMIHKKGIS